jgi:hypothetical protein
MMPNKYISFLVSSGEASTETMVLHPSNTSNTFTDLYDKKLIVSKVNISSTDVVAPSGDYLSSSVLHPHITHSLGASGWNMAAKTFLVFDSWLGWMWHQ